MIELSNVALPLDAACRAATPSWRAAAARALGVPEAQVAQVEVLKRSVDARKKGNVHFVATLAVALADGAAEERLLARASRRTGGARGARGARARRFEPAPPLEVPDASAAALACGEARPVVVGAGPAGLFCALYLAKAGLRPLLVERGGSVEERCAAVAAFDAAARSIRRRTCSSAKGAPAPSPTACLPRASKAPTCATCSRRSCRRARHRRSCGKRSPTSAPTFCRRWCARCASASWRLAARCTSMRS